MTSTIKKINSQNKGQVLLFVIISMSIALAIGVAISTRTLSSLQRVTRTDTASKVYSGAEGGAEAFIVLPDSYLEDIIDTHSDLGELCRNYDWDSAPSDIGRGCIIDYHDTETDTITRATVTVEPFQTNDIVDGESALIFFLDEANTQEVLVSHGSANFSSSMKVCFDNQDANLYLVGYNDKGIHEDFKAILVPVGGSKDDYDAQFQSYLKDATASSYTDFPYCYELASDEWFASLDKRPYGIRVRALRGSTNVAVIPNNTGIGNFPNQGFLITSSAEISTEGITKSVKTVKVYKTYRFMPGIFDYSIYSEGPIVGF